MQTPLCRYTSQIAFADTDASGWMHFTKVFRHVEEAEHHFLNQRGVLVYDRDQGGWPRVQVSCDYQRPLVMGDVIEIHLDLTRIGNASLTWEFEILTASGEVAASGGMITVRVDAHGKSKPISDAERQALS
jgi:YbgC/YbaW family acyl-CoA thioester hydrolase